MGHKGREYCVESEDHGVESGSSPHGTESSESGIFTSSGHSKHSLDTSQVISCFQVITVQENAWYTPYGWAGSPDKYIFWWGGGEGSALLYR